MIPGGRTAYATWWEAYELAGAHATESTIRHQSDTQRGQDDSHSDGRDAVVDSNEALAVLRHLAAEEGEASAYDALAGELATLRAQRQAALGAATEAERKAWSDGGDHAVRAAVRAVREALGATR